MSHVPNRAAFMRAAQRLATMSQPDLDEYEAVTTTLAQVFTDQTGIACKVSIQLDHKSAAEALAKLEGESCPPA